MEAHDLLETLLKEKRKATGRQAVLTFLIGVLVLGIFALPLMAAWNYVIPHLTGLPALGYWQSFSLLFLLIVVRVTLFYKSK